MKKKINQFKMGTCWLKLFMSPKKKNKGWKCKKQPLSGTVMVFKPDGSIFGIWEPDTGILHSKEHIMNVQP